MFNRLEAMWYWLTTDPIGFIIYLIYFTVSLLGTLVLHEYAHAFIAYKCGDPTAKMLGRLTLNPAKHLDPLGTLSMVLLGFGWAKPVPINPRNFKNRVQDDFLVSIAGITVNFTLFIICTALMVGLNRFIWKPEVINFYGAHNLLASNSIGYSAILSGNISANKELFLNQWLPYVQRFLMMFSKFNLVIAVFNFLPIPPLDGFHIFNNILLKGKLQLNAQTYRIMNIILIFLMFSGVLGKIITLITSAIEGGVLKIFLYLTGVI